MKPFTASVPLTAPSDAHVGEAPGLEAKPKFCGAWANVAEAFAEVDERFARQDLHGAGVSGRDELVCAAVG